MAINEALSHFSDVAFEGAVAGYVTALVCYAAEFASLRTRPGALVEARSAAPSPAMSTAGAVRGGMSVPSGSAFSGNDLSEGGLAGLVGEPGTAGKRPARSAPQPWGERFGRAAVAVTVVGFAAHLVALVARGFAVHRPPWGNMYEFTLMITGAAVAGWLVVLARTKSRSIGVFVMAPVTVLVFLAGTVLYTTAGPLVPALHSYWLIIHVFCISVSSGVLMLSGIASTMYLVRDRVERKAARTAALAAAAPGGLRDGSDASQRADAARVTGLSSATSRLPSLASLDRIAYRTAIAAFPVYTFAVIAGALWAEVAWGTYWGWDPKETVALVTWILYAGYLHARATAGWRGRPAAWISVVGLISIVFNLFFVNMVISGLHSYAGLN